ncbi:MAG: peptide ABC transporter substrate-binding protein [Bdellovibrionales bacterium]|nr:peptide ABC transporter substrate-binding protein [Bdellovibrionales bacterium]
MKKSRKFLKAMTSSVFMVFIFLAAMPVEASRENGPQVRISATIPSIDWHTTMDLASARVILNVMEGLTRIDGAGKVSPAIAEKWTVSKDFRTYTFYLKKNVKWSDGVPVSAQHFVDAFHRLFDPKTAARGAFFLWAIKGSEAYSTGKGLVTDLGLHAIDDSTLEMKLERPCSYLPAMLAHTVAMPFRKDLFEKFGDQWTTPGKLAVVGPYNIESWTHEQIVLQANPKFHGPTPTVPRFTLRIVEEDTTALNLYRGGKLDVVYAPPRLEWPTLKQSPEFKIFPNVRVNGMVFNTSKAPFDNALVRKAFAHATDVPSLAKVLEGPSSGNSQTVFRPLKGWIPEGFVGANPSVGLRFDPVTAAKYLADAGYPGGKGFPKVVMGTDVREEHKMMAEYLQAQWKKHLGVNVEIDIRDSLGHLGRLRTDPPHIFRFGIGAVYHDPDIFASIFIKGTGFNYSRWTNDRYDHLVATAAGTQDPAKRAKMYDEAQKVLLETEAVMIPMTVEALPAIVSTKLKGFDINVQGVPIMHYATF